MAVRIQFRRGTAAEWAAADPTLAAGELGYETDTAQIKIGNGSDAWADLAYAAVSASYIDDAIANVVGLSPEDLDTLQELAASIDNDPDFVGTINSAIADAEANALLYTNNSVEAHSSETTNVHGIADTSLLETTSGAQAKADAAQSNAASYTDTAIANLVDSSPSTLDTLNELAAALGDDPNFATTISSSLGARLSFIADTSENLLAANAVTEANTIYLLTNDAGYVKIGDGVSNYGDIPYLGVPAANFAVDVHNNESTDVHGIPDTSQLVYQNAFSTVQDTLDAHVEATTDVHGISDAQNLIYQADLDQHAGVSVNVHGISNAADIVYGTDLTATLADYATLVSPTFTGEVVLPGDTTIGDITPVELGYLANVTSDIQGQLDNTLSQGVTDTLYAPIDVLADATLTGSATLPASTTIGNVSANAISYLGGANELNGYVQDQLDAKLSTASAAATYAPINDPNFTGNVSFWNAMSLVIPPNSDFDIAGLDGMQISSYLADIDRNVKNALDNAVYYGSSDPLPMVGIGNVTYEALSVLEYIDAANVWGTIDYLAGTTSNIQDQLDSKAALAGATFTGDVEMPNITVTGNLIVSGTTTTVNAQNLSVRDNMVYLNADSDYTLTNAVGDGTNVVYTINETTQGSVGDYIIVSNTTPSSFDTDNNGLQIIAITSNTITVASSVTDTYVSGGNVNSRTHTNPDLGWAGGHYHENTYQHAGVFLDASDSVFKFFDGYTPEPDADAFIDTGHVSFALAPIAASEVTAANLIATTGVIFPDNTIQTSAGVASLTGFTEKTANYTLDTLDHKDNVVEMNSGSAITFTIPNDSALGAWPVGASMDIFQTGSGQVTIAGDTGVTVHYTPGNKLRTQYSSCTIMKRSANVWYLYGDLTA